MLKDIPKGFVFKKKESFYQGKTGILHILSYTCISDSFDALTC